MVTGSTVYVGSCAGTYYAFDLESGAVRWEHDFMSELGHATFHGDPLLTGDILITGTEGLDPVHMRAFNPRTGETMWQRNGEWALTRSDIVSFDGLAVGRNDRGDAVALDVRSGELRWHVTHQGRRFQPDVAESPDVHEQRVFFSAPDGAVYGVEATSGEVAWRRDVGCDVSTTTTADGQDVYVGCRDGRIFRLGTADGTERGRMKLPGPLEGRLAVLADRVVVPGGPHWIGALDRELTGILWSYAPSDRMSVVQPFVWDDMILTGNTGSLIALDLEDGTPRWTARLEGSIRGLGRQGNILLVGTVEGVLYAIDAGSLR